MSIVWNELRENKSFIRTNTLPNWVGRTQDEPFVSLLVCPFFDKPLYRQHHSKHWTRNSPYISVSSDTKTYLRSESFSWKPQASHLLSKTQISVSLPILGSNFLEKIRISRNNNMPRFISQERILRLDVIYKINFSLHWVWVWANQLKSSWNAAIALVICFFFQIAWVHLKPLLNGW